MKQIDVVLQYLAPDGTDGSLANAIHYVYKRCQSVGRSTDDLSDNFWRVCLTMDEGEFDKAREQVDPSALSPLFTKLQTYYKLVCVLGWDLEEEKTIEEMIKLVKN